MIEDRKATLRREIEKREKELAKLEALPDFGMLTNGTVACLWVTYGGSRPYAVIALKANGSWYLTGERSPNNASAEGLAEWLSTGGRRLVGMDVLAEIQMTSVDVVDLSRLVGSVLLERG